MRRTRSGRIIKLPPAISYVVAVGAAVAAVLLRLALDPVWGSKLPYITLFPAIMVSAWLGGLWPGIVTTVIAGTAAVYFWIEPTGSWAIAETSELLGVLIFAVVGIVISALNEAWRREADAVAESEERLSVTLSSIGDAVITTDDEGRVTRLNAAAEQLTGWTQEEVLGRPLKDIDAGASLTDLRLAGERGRQTMEGWRAAKDGRVFVTELITNAVKHAFPDGRKGRIVVRSKTCADGRFELQVSDNGVGLTEEDMSNAKRNGSMGIRVIEALSGQLDAKHEWSGPGTVFTLTTGPAGSGDPA